MRPAAGRLEFHTVFFIQPDKCTCVYLAGKIPARRLMPRPAAVANPPRCGHARRSSEGLQRPPQTRSKAFGPHQPAAYFHGTAGINRAGAIIRARGLGVLGGVLLSKTTKSPSSRCPLELVTKSLYIRFFLFFHFLYDFSKSIGTTHPNNLNRKNRVGKLLTCFCFYKTASGCQLTPQPSKVRNRIGVCSNRDKAIHS